MAQTEHPTPDAGARAGTTDVFLSYSRRDREFVEWLHAELSRRGKAAWVDWEDIPDWSPDYEAELEVAIRSADTFVFVLSPASLESLNCRRELDVAVAGGKRIRPVLHRPVADESVPPSLRKPQWLDLSGRADDAVDKLVASLDVDPEWVRAHTRLLVRAQEWETGGRDGSQLLRGDDLRAAERALEGQAGKDPPPTALQTELVLASRRGASRRQRLVLGSVIAALAVAVGLAIFALVQRSNAIHDAQVARSRELAARSQAAPGSTSREVLELALRATDEARTPEAEEALRSALARSRVVGVATGDLAVGSAFVDGGPTALVSCGDGALHGLADGAAVECPAGVTRNPYGRAVFTPDGRRALQLGERRSRVVDTATGEVLATLAAGQRQTQDGAALAPDGRSALTLGDQHAARLWALPADGGAATRRWTRSAVHAVAFSPDGRRFVTGDDDGTLRLWSTRDLRPLGALRGLPPPAQLVALADDGTVAEVADDGGALWTPAQPGRPVRVPGALVAAFSPDGRLAAFARESGRVEVWRTTRPVRRVSSFRSPPGNLAFTPDGRQLTVAFDTVGVWDPSTGRRLATLSPPAGQILLATPSATGRLVVTQGFDGVTRLWRPAPAPLLGEIPLRAPQGERLWHWRGSAAAAAGSHAGTGPNTVVSADRTRAADAGRAGIEVWDVATGRGRTTIRADRPTGTVLSADGQRVAAVVPGDGTIRVWSTADGRELAVVPAPVADGADRLALGPDGGQLVFRRSYSHGATLLDVDSGRTVSLRLPDDTSATADVTFSPDGRRIAVARRDDVRLFDGNGGPLDVPPPRHETPLQSEEGVESATFSPDGRLLLTTGRDETTRLWDAETGAARYVVPGSSPPAFSPDGNVFAAVGERGLVVRSVATGRVLLTVPGAAPPFAVSPDGLRIVTWREGVLRTFGCDACGTLDRLRALAQRRLGEG